MSQIRKIAPCLWFDHQAEEAIRFYDLVRVYRTQLEWAAR
jgi:predicted 3-demethylubiquinone-9 3-methyltransferase (glyoxalase superfamily)